MIVLKPYQNRVLGSLRDFLRACSSGVSLPHAFHQVLTANEFPEVPYFPVISEGLGPAMPYVCLRVPTGGGKTYLACALAHKACREGYNSYYVKLTRLFQELDIGRADGRYAKIMRQCAKADVLIMDEWGLAVLTDQHRRDLLEILDDRYNLRATIITSQLPVAHWHEAIGDPTLADAILDRVVHNAYKINLSGKTMREDLEKLTTGRTKA